MKVTKADKAARKHWLMGAALLIFSAACATTTVAPTNGTSQQSSGDLSSPPASSAAHAIDVTSVHVGADGPDETSIVITADGSLIDYTSFAVHNPPSLVVDLPNARNAISQPVNLLPAGSPIVLVHAMQIQQGSTPILRLMFDLNRLLPYRVESSRNSLQILIGEKVSQQVPVVQQPAELEQATEPVVGPVESVEERARNVTPAALMVAAKPASNADQAAPPSEKPRSATPEPPLAKKPIVSEVELPVLSPVEPAKTGSLRTAQSSAASPPAAKDETPPAIPKKPAASSAGKRRTREATDGTRQKTPKEAPPPASAVAEQETAPAPQTPEVPAANKRLSLDFKEADLDDLLRLISQVSGLNIVAAHGLKDRKERDITVRLTNVEWRQALDVILRAKGLSYEQDGNLLYVGSKNEIQKSKEERVKDIEVAALKNLRIEEERQKVAEAKRKAEEERRRVEEEERRYVGAPRCTTVIRLAHMKAPDMKRHLERLKTRFGRIDTEESTHTLIVTDKEPVCQEMAAHAKELDMPPRDPFVTKLLPFNYAKAADLKTHLAALKTTQGSVIVDERSSRIIVKDLPEAVERMETLLKQIDIPTPQVLIEARIVEATRKFSQSLGIQWGGTGIPTKPGSATGVTAFGGSSSSSGSSSSEGSSSSGGSSIQFPGLTPSTGNPFPDTGGGVPFLGPVPLALNLPVASPHLAIGMTVGSLANRFLVGAQLSVAENEGKLRTLSSPRVATQDNEEAEIKQGTQVPYTTIDSSGRTVVQFQDAFIKLKVKPHITPDGRVSMKVEAERSFPGEKIIGDFGFVFPINTRKATTNILVQNGSTVVIGGLLQSSESISEDKVPTLGDIPVLGWLFKRRSIGPDERVELLIFLTPSVLQESRR